MFVVASSYSLCRGQKLCVVDSALTPSRNVHEWTSYCSVGGPLAEALKKANMSASLVRQGSGGLYVETGSAWCSRTSAAVASPYVAARPLGGLTPPTLKEDGCVNELV